MPRLPLYQTIAGDIHAGIRAGEFPPGSQLPSETDLGRRYQVSRMTVRQALDLLASDGLVARRQGSGTYVTEARRGRRLKSLRSFGDEVAGIDAELTNRVVSADVVQPPEEVAAALGLARDEHVSRLRRVRLLDGIPSALQDAWIPYGKAPGLTREPLVEGSLYRTLREKYGLQFGWADHLMSGATLAPEEAELLNVPPGGAVLYGQRTTYTTAAEPIEFTYSWTLPDFPLLMRIEPE